MTDLRKAAEMAIVALDHTARSAVEQYVIEQQVVSFLKQALAQPEQEPVAWNGWVLREVFFDNGDPCGHREPPSKPWVSLTDDEIYELRKKTFDGFATNHEVYRAIEAALRSKNT